MYYSRRSTDRRKRATHEGCHACSHLVDDVSIVLVGLPVSKFLRGPSDLFIIEKGMFLAL